MIRRVLTSIWLGATVMSGLFYEPCPDWALFLFLFNLMCSVGAFWRAHVC